MNTEQTSTGFAPGAATPLFEAPDWDEAIQVPVAVKRLRPTATLPEYAHDLDSCFDLFTDDNVEIERLGVRMVSTGIALQAPAGWDFQLEDRSGLAAKNGLFILGGVIDPGYDGELKVIIGNLGDRYVAFGPGQKICQVRMQRRVRATFREVDVFEDRDDRAAQGFGSTGMTRKHQ